MLPACAEIRRNILRISKESGHGHIPTCFSIVEILHSLYTTMKHHPAQPDWNERDIFILSKGHAALAHYCTLAHFGYFPIDSVFSFGHFMSSFGCHADRSKIPGIEVSTGSLGHGIGVAAGVALAFKIRKSPRQVYTIIGDGESNEGTVWEATMVAVNQKLSNLTIIYDDNRSHSRGLQIQKPAAHFQGFGCDVIEVAGHDDKAITEALLKPGSGVKVIVAHTEKGYGCNMLIQNHYEWHRRSPNNEEFLKLMGELDEKAI